jgi:hypothetical protein
MILNKLLEIHNEWWKIKKVRENLVSKFKLEVFEEVKKSVDNRQITILTVFNGK